MKQIYGIIGALGIFLFLGAAFTYAYADNYAGWNMMGENGNLYTSMMGGYDNNTIEQMNELHDQVIKNLDPATAKEMDEMHDACMGNFD